MKFGDLSGRPVKAFSTLILILLGACPSQPGQAPYAIDTDICSLRAHPKQFDKKRVRVAAGIVRSMHGTVILDPSNESCDIGLWYASEAERKGTFVAMDKMVLQERAKGVLGNKIVAVLTGVFLAKPKREHAPVLEAEQVENLELESSDPKSGDGKRN